MSADEQRATGLPPAILVAILTAANARASLDAETVDALLQWLENVLARAIRRASARPLAKGDVDRLEAAYRRFRDVVQNLQDRNDPPPQIPVSHGSTDWEHWLVDHQHFGFRRGRREGSDWKLIGALLALYEATAGKRASAAKASNPTMRYLAAALSALASHAPPSLRSNFAPPNAEALRQQLPRLRDSTMSWEAKRLAAIIGRRGD